MKQEMVNLLIFMAVCFIGYLIFRNVNLKEGLTTETSAPSSNPNSGVAGGAASYAAKVKAEAIKQQDILLINKYRSDYENTILNLDELLDSIMLNTALNVNLSNPTPDLIKLSNLSGAKAALNGVMKHVDSK